MIAFLFLQPIFLNEVAVRRLGEEDGDCLLQVSHIDRVYNLKAPSLTERYILFRSNFTLLCSTQPYRKVYLVSLNCVEWWIWRDPALQKGLNYLLSRSESILYAISAQLTQYQPKGRGLILGWRDDNAYMKWISLCDILFIIYLHSNIKIFV